MDGRKELERFLKVAVRACRTAGRIQMKAFGKVRQVEHKGEIDLVTDVDRHSEDRIIELLTGTFPDHGYLTEERPPSMGESEYLWIVDPLDGTTNYSRGFPVFAVSVALAWKGRPVVGAVYSPVLRDLYTACRGKGAFLNGKRISVSRRSRLGEAFLATGFPYDIRRSKRNNLENFARFATRCLAIRRAGAAAMDLAWVAAGRFDGFWELKLKPWDTAAGLLLVEEAGGRVTLPSGRPFRLGSRDILASNGLVHGEMLDVLREVRRQRPRSSLKGEYPWCSE